MKILAIHASKDTPNHLHDAVGAFIPEAIGFQKARTAVGDVVDREPFDNSLEDYSARRAAVLTLIRKAAPFDAFAYFGHGLRTGLPSAGFSLQTIGPLVDALHAAMPKDVRIVFYACSTANSPNGGVDGDGGFADELRDRLSLLGHTGWLDAHVVPGHTTINRMTRRFYLDGLARGTGGTWLVAPGSPEWAAWGRELEDDKPLRFGFPFMTSTEVHAKLAAG